MIAKLDNEGNVLCAWWALCENIATDAEPHPVLGDVPICERCKAKLEELR